MSEKILVVVIDYDNDIGRAGIETPVRGYESVLRAAEEFGLRRPQDSDLNSIFSALKIYNELRSRGYNADIVIVSGSERGGLEAFQNIRDQMRLVLSREKYDSAIIVSDGGEDEKVYPLIQSMIRVDYIERVVVEQARSVEATYILLWRYFRKVLEEPRLSKILIGYPGIVLLAFSVLALANLLIQGVLVSLLILSLLMIYRGFNIEDLVVASWRRNPTKTFSYIGGVLVMVIAVIFTYLVAVSEISSGSSQYRVIGSVLSSTAWIYALGISLPVVGEALNRVLRRSFSVWKYIMAVLSIIYVSVILGDLGEVLKTLPHSVSTDTLIKAVTGARLVEKGLAGFIAIISGSLILELVGRLYYSRRRSRSGRPGV